MARIHTKRKQTREVLTAKRVAWIESIQSPCPHSARVAVVSIVSTVSFEEGPESITPFNNTVSKKEGRLDPPRKKMADKADMMMMLEYSAKKKKTKGMAECSVKYPATSSDSLSGRSKGVLFVSANTDMK